MPRIGVTGHVLLAEGTAALVLDCLDRQLARYPHGSLHGVTCLADGADQLFARAVLARGGTFEAIIPARDYRRNAVEPANRAAFDELLDRAVRVSYMPFATSGREAYLAASEELLNRCDLLLAVWDGRPSAGVGDTADVVRVARERGLPVVVLWPAGARRRAPAGQ
ncbi:hypothetical protein [Micromonospora echinofusca]|uniref:Nucleoside 2-deoxyribosyltransferase n=1 Tax=Micromonospora echinofusca TaxID=47858 RepID=A0ABS3VUM3_MICEH|nr:hypothetical protein [Micromonospora echinofusca]MBO4208166.1 hypothetical protein [Micromonospora echinofusca]